MRSVTQLGLFLGVFVVGGAGGAGILHVVSTTPKAERGEVARWKAPRARTLEETPTDEQRLEELRHALARLGVRTDSEAMDSTALDAETPRADEAEAALAKDAEALSGESAAEVLARLEREYKAVLATRAEEVRAAQAAPPEPEAVAIAREEPPAPQVIAPLLGAPEPAANAHLAQNSNVQIVQGDVVAGDVHTTTVNETSTNQIAIHQYQQLFLVSQGAVSGQRYAPSSAPPQRQRGPSPQDSNPWAGVDYGSHYANPWGSPFGRRP